MCARMHAHVCACLCMVCAHSSVHMWRAEVKLGCLYCFPPYLRLNLQLIFASYNAFQICHLWNLPSTRLLGGHWSSKLKILCLHNVVA